MTKMTNQDLDLIFREARSYRYWQTSTPPISDDQIKEIYDLMKWGPTANNSQPARFVWVRTDEAKQKLANCVLETNQRKVLEAPVTVIIATDQSFFEDMSRLTYNGEEVAKMFKNDPHLYNIGLRNSSLQGADLIIAARALGFDCGPMSGFDPDKLNAEFFPDGKFKVNFICALGKGDKSRLHPREYRYEFEETNVIS